MPATYDSTNNDVAKRCQRTRTPGLSVSKRMTTYPPGGTTTVSWNAHRVVNTKARAHRRCTALGTFRMGRSKFRSGTPLVHDSSEHSVPATQLMSELSTFIVIFAVVLFTGGNPIRITLHISDDKKYTCILTKHEQCVKTDI